MAVQITRRRFTVDEYYQMAAAGILTEDDRVELIEGEIVEMVALSARHAATVKRLNKLSSGLMAQGRVILGVQDPVRLGPYSEPQPDVAVLRPRSDAYASAHPGPEDIDVLIEVCQTSTAYNRTVKLPLYARAGVRGSLDS